MTQANWSDDRVEQLKTLWTEGLSASQIARALGGVTRNAVIGKVHRLGLAGRASPSRNRSIALTIGVMSRGTSKNLLRRKLLPLHLRLQRRRLRLHQFHDVVHHRRPIDRVVGLAGGVNHVPPVAAAGHADVGHQRLTWAIHHATDDRQRQRGLDMTQPFFQRAHRLDHVVALARARR